MFQTVPDASWSDLYNSGAIEIVKNWELPG